jgi:hypothetical protein
MEAGEAFDWKGHVLGLYPAVLLPHIPAATKRTSPRERFGLGISSKLRRNLAPAYDEKAGVGLVQHDGARSNGGRRGVIVKYKKADLAARTRYAARPGGGVTKPGRKLSQNYEAIFRLKWRRVVPAPVLLMDMALAPWSGFVKMSDSIG